MIFHPNGDGLRAHDWELRGNKYGIAARCGARTVLVFEPEYSELFLELVSRQIVAKLRQHQNVGSESSDRFDNSFDASASALADVPSDELERLLDHDLLLGPPLID